MAKRMKYIPKALKDAEFKNNKGRPSYRTSKAAVIKLTPEQKVEAAKLFEMVKNILYRTTLDVNINSRKIEFVAGRILGGIEFDIDAGSRPLEKAVNDSNIRGGIQKYLKFLS